MNCYSTPSSFSNLQQKAKEVLYQDGLIYILLAKSNKSLHDTNNKHLKYNFSSGYYRDGIISQKQKKKDTETVCVIKLHQNIDYHIH